MIEIKVVRQLRFVGSKQRLLLYVSIQRLNRGRDTLRLMFKKSEKKPDPKDVPPFGGLESITDEEIMKNIRDYPYVMGKLKDC